MATSARILERLLDRPGSGEELARELYDLVSVEIERGVEPRPGALELLASLDGRRPIGLASNSNRAFVEAVLASAGLADAFPVLVTAQEVAEPKPAPDVYLRACELLRSEPSESIALEDSAPGAASARAAGLYVIGVPYFPGLGLECDLAAESLADHSVAVALGL